MPKERDTIRDIISESIAKDRARDTSENTIEVDLTPLARQMLHAEESGKRAALFVLDGLDVGNLIPLEDRPITMGRSPECDVILRDDGISRKHAKIHLIDNNQMIVQDLGSTNGIYVGGSRVAKATLRQGEKVLFGRRTMLKFVLEDRLDRLYQQEMYASSTRDGLTGIHNGKYVKERIVSDLSYARRHRTPLTFVLFDVDNLREVNRRYGHQTGDQILVTLTQLFSAMIRTEDVFGRTSGEEFAIIAPGVDMKGGRVLGERICQRAADEEIRALGKSGDKVKVTVSVGVVCVHKNAVVDSARVLSEVNKNLQAAKEDVQNKVVITQIN